MYFKCPVVPQGDIRAFELLVAAGRFSKGITIIAISILNTRLCLYPAYGESCVPRRDHLREPRSLPTVSQITQDTGLNLFTNVVLVDNVDVGDVWNGFHHLGPVNIETTARGANNTPE